MTVKRLETKIEKSKFAVDCWGKGKQAFNGRKNQILSTAQKLKEIKRIKKNM